MFFTSITVAQVEVLERTFAYLTDSGWAIPPWLVYLKYEVELRDYYAGTGAFPGKTE